MTANLLWLYPDVPFNGTMLQSPVAAATYTQETVAAGARSEHFRAASATTQTAWAWDLQAGYSAPIPVTSGLVLHLDGSDASTITQSNGLISQWNDKSGGGYDFTQGTAANKPYLTRSDSLENRIKSSEDITGTGWDAAVNATKTSATVLTEASDINQYHYLNQSFEVVKGASYTISLDIKKGNRDWVQIQAYNASPAAYSYFNINTGALGAQDGLTDRSITDLGSGVYRCSIVFTADASRATEGVMLMLASADGTIQYNGNGTNAVTIYKSHLRRSGTSSTYVATTTYPQYAGLNGRAVPYFPGAATYMSRAFTAALDLLVGDNTIFAIYNLDGALDATTAYDLLSTNGGGSTKGAVVRVAHADYKALLVTYNAGTNTLSSTSTDTKSQVQLRSFVKSSTTGYHYLNGIADNSGSLPNAATSSANAINLGNITNTGIRGYLPEVIVFNRALSASEISLMQDYLTAKWITQSTSQPDRFALCRADLMAAWEPTSWTVQGSADSNFSTTESFSGVFSLTSLKGVRPEDFITSIPFAAAWRYWRVALSTQNAVTHEISKIYLCDTYDPGREPTLEPMTMSVDKKDPSWREPLVKFKLVWRGLSASAKQEMISKVAKYADTNSIVLHDTADYVLHGIRAFHCRIVDYGFEQIHPNNYTLSVEFEELT